jgi:hypothetical protein
VSGTDTCQTLDTPFIRIVGATEFATYANGLKAIEHKTELTQNRKNKMKR